MQFSMHVICTHSSTVLVYMYTCIHIHVQSECLRYLWNPRCDTAVVVLPIGISRMRTFSENSCALSITRPRSLSPPKLSPEPLSRRGGEGTSLPDRSHERVRGGNPASRGKPRDKGDRVNAVFVYVLATLFREEVI